MSRSRSSLLLCIVIAICGCRSARWHWEDRAWYVGAGVGQARGGVENCNPGDYNVGPGNDCTVSSEVNTGDKVFAGYQFNRYFAVEAEHARLGTFTQTLTTHACCGPPVTETNTSAYSADVAYAAGIWPITQDFGLTGRLGLGVVTGGDTIGVGIGAKYDFDRNVGVRLDYEQFSLYGPLEIDWHVRLLTANVVYYFR